MEYNKENTGYFSDDERFEVDTLNDAVERNNTAERYGDIIDIDAEETPYLDLDSKPAAKPTATRTTAAKPTSVRSIYIWHANPPTSPSVERVGSFVIQLILILIIIHQHIMLASRCPMPKHPT